MVRPDRDLLRGTVEVDETFLTLKGRTAGRRQAAKGKPRGGTSHLVTVAVAVEVRQPKGFGCVRLRRIEGPTKDAIVPFVREHVAPDATLRTDGSPIYYPLQEAGFAHDPRVILRGKTPAHKLLPGVHRLASLLKRWLLGTHHGAVHLPHVDYYLDEFSFRFNRRTSRSRGMLFYRLIQQAAVASPVTYANIRDNQPRRWPPQSLPGRVQLDG